jgi:hypothetical protein
MKNAKQNSDWDVLMVLAKNRIWLGRFFLAVTLQLIGKRRHGNKVKERFCLNHYIAENGLILEEHNEFSANFVSNSMPILGGVIYKKLLQMNEFWIQTIKPNYKKEEISEKHRNTLEFILKNGSLATRILNSLGEDFSEGKFQKLYSNLGNCLLENTLFKP